MGYALLRFVCYNLLFTASMRWPIFFHCYFPRVSLKGAPSTDFTRSWYDIETGASLPEVNLAGGRPYRMVLLRVLSFEAHGSQTRDWTVSINHSRLSTLLKREIFPLPLGILTTPFIKVICRLLIQKSNKQRHTHMLVHSISLVVPFLPHCFPLGSWKWSLSSFLSVWCH